VIDLINPAAKETLSQSLDLYFKKWDSFIDRVGLRDYANKMKPVALGWKVATNYEYRRMLSTLELYSKQSHGIKVGKRKIATFVLDDTLQRGIGVIKVLERGNNINEKLGLDHVEFFVPNTAGIPEILDKSEVNWKVQGNDNFQRIVIRFGPEKLLEARLGDHTILDISANELTAAGKKLVGPLDLQKKS
jgi:hypothetical protein